jgi:transcriptional regulator with XRE-family HTH domain
VTFHESTGKLNEMPRSGVRGFRADRLRDFRVRAGLSADDLAAKVGSSRQAVSTWEVGRSTPPPAMLGRLAHALDISVAALVPLPASQLRLADLRVLAALSQNEAAKRLDVSPTLLGEIERGQKPPTAERVHALAIAYGVTDRSVEEAWHRTQQFRRTRAANL